MALLEARDLGGLRTGPENGERLPAPLNLSLLTEPGRMTVTEGCSKDFMVPQSQHKCKFASSPLL